MPPSTYVLRVGAAVGASPLFQDGYETGDFGADANGFSYNIPAQDNGSISVVAANPNTGTYASRYRFNAVASGTDNHVEQSFDFPDSNKVWVEFYLRVPVGYAHRNEGQHKIFAIWGADYSTAGRPGVVFEWWRGSSDSESNWRFTAFLNGDGFFTTVQSGPLATGNSGNAWDLTPGEYHRIRVYTAVGTPGTGNGVLKCWVDSSLICSRTDLVMVDQADPTHVFNAGWLMGYSNAGYAAQTDFYIDDFKLWTSDPEWS